MPFDFSQRATRAITFAHLNPGDTIWVGRGEGDRTVRLQIEGRWDTNTLDCTVLQANGGIAKLHEDAIDGSHYFVGPRGERGKPVYITEVEDKF